MAESNKRYKFGITPIDPQNTCGLLEVCETPLSNESTPQPFQERQNPKHWPLFILILEHNPN